MTNNPLPRLVTFDGEARSGKGTVVQLTKDYLRDVGGLNVMLIDAGQVFRVLVVGMMQAGVNLDDPSAIDAYLDNEDNSLAAARLVKQVYYMEKAERDSLLYTNLVGVNSAKIGARPLSQAFKDELLKKWLRDARTDGFDTVLLDGRALEETGIMLENEGLCQFRLGLYFVCDPIVGARRTLGLAARPYDRLNEADRMRVDELVIQITERNDRDRQRPVQPIIPPSGAPICVLPDISPAPHASSPRPMVIIDTSAEIAKIEMATPVAQYTAAILDGSAAE